MSGPKPLRGVTTKEHAGGTPTVHVEWQEDHPIAIPTEEFNYGMIDRPADHILEAAKSGGDVEGIILRVLAEGEGKIREETVNQVLGYIICSDKPRLACYALAFTCNLSIVENLTPAEAARRCGVSKQDVYQAVDRVCAKLGLRKTGWMRDEEAKERMSKSNFRRSKDV